jgi:AcrR family transcriptional regulator
MAARKRLPTAGTTTDTHDDKRNRILHAAMETFREKGFAAATTLDIATRARVSKRELYALVGNKQQMLIACITERATRLEAPADTPMPRDRQGLQVVLASFGRRVLCEVTEPTVVAIFRLAIAEAINAPEVAQALDSIGRETSRAALRHLMAQARTSGLLDGRPAQLAEQFGGLLWCDLMVSLLLGVADRPGPREMAERAEKAAAAFLALHPGPNSGATSRRETR